MSSPALLQHEAEPLEDLAKRLEPRLKRILARYNIPAQDAEDLLQTSLIATLRSWSKLNDPEGWLIKTTVNQCLMYWRSRRRRPESTLDRQELDFVCPPVPSPEDRIVDRWELERHIATLPPICQRLLRLRYTYGFSLTEIAEMLGLKASSIYGYSHRCLKMLSKNLPAPGKKNPDESAD